MSSRAECPSCGSSTALGTVHCFKCGRINIQYSMTPGFFTDYEAKTQVLKLRDDLVLKPSQFSPTALHWLYTSCVYDDTIVKQRIGYCTSIDKVLIPAFCEQELMFYQLRSLVEGDKLKYITYGKMMDWPLHYCDHKYEDKVIIVEDHISAIRLREHYNVLALNGTNINFKHLQYLCRYFNNFVFWLDADAPGQTATYKCARKLQQYYSSCAQQRLFLGTQVANFSFTKVNNTVVTEDPKMYINSTIKSIIENEVTSI